MKSNLSHLRMCASADGAVILDTKLGTISRLNSTGAQVWEAFRRGQDVETIAVDLARETGEQIEALERDVRDFIQTLVAQHVLVD
jgi:hypothetical protein